MADSIQESSNALDSFDNVVVLMLENRSFDNLLGNLYIDGVPGGKSFEGLQNYTKEMPVPPRAVDYNTHKTVPVQTAQDFHQPFPDPGEVYQHINTQLYNFVDQNNINIPEQDMVSPYNIPSPIPPDNMQMLGFVNDYINRLQALDDKKYPQFDEATFDLYKVIMQVYMPSQVSVLSTLAKEFAVFDHWFCSVPSQTWCNRAFWHAATSGGQVINPGEDKGIIGNIEGMKDWIENVWSQKTLFELMEDANVSHGIYTENPVSLTTVVNGPFKNENVIHMGDELSEFKEHVENGSLPQYTFIEPKFFGQHNDQHPSSLSGLIDGPTKVGSVLLGENLIWDVYNTIFTNDTYKNNTLLIITHDEHGGCFDHVIPGSTIPPVPGMKGQKGFTFDRLGVRVPMVMVSAHIAQNTIVNDVFDHTSFIRTMCKKWNMPHLTNRDKNAKSFEQVFSSSTRSFPVIEKHVIPEIEETTYDKDDLNDLQKSILLGASFLAKRNCEGSSKEVDINKAKQISTVGDAISFLKEIKDLI
ncbi:alkaline phosphatase family protein [uncultured Aquimarina sp.]|uniref:alkaline phosphatase family protein n=1 Tax=uncultured Aquimarina sp. TaxID=575652 RepID=UPI00260F8DE1|nr:alkaline phosphatase family protein [uncultured Aquimarina sp.]